MRHLLASCLLAFLLAACDPGSQALFLSANVMSYVQTDKTLVDHGVSAATDEDCSTLTWAEGEGYCQDEAASEDLAIAPAAAGPFCYRSLATVVCYSEPDPNAGPNAALGSRIEPPAAPNL